MLKMEIAVHMTGMEDVIDNQIRMGDKVSKNTERKVEFQVEEWKRQCQTNNLVNMWSKDVLMANMCWSMEYVTVFCPNGVVQLQVRYHVELEVI